LGLLDSEFGSVVLAKSKILMLPAGGYSQVTEPSSPSTPNKLQLTAFLPSRRRTRTHTHPHPPTPNHPHAHQRLPQWGPRGKIFSRVAVTMSDSPADPEPLTMLQLKLMNYLDLVPRLAPGSVYIGWSDLLLFFDAEGIDFHRPGTHPPTHPPTQSTNQPTNQPLAF
jgi:hypothetical protein